VHDHCTYDYAIIRVVPKVEREEFVNVGVIVLRRTQPDMERPFRVPFVPLFPIIGAILVVYLMTRLPATTWWRFGIWLLLGFAIYFFYSRRHSRVQQAAQGGEQP
jgi:basic amino acid/polyamine antiporter, APA family